MIDQYFKFNGQFNWTVGSKLNCKCKLFIILYNGYFEKSNTSIHSSK